MSNYSAAMHIYSAVQQSVANGEDSEWDEEVGDDDPEDACEMDGGLDDEHEALEEFVLNRSPEGND